MQNPCDAGRNRRALSNQQNIYAEKSTQWTITVIVSDSMVCIESTHARAYNEIGYARNCFSHSNELIQFDSKEKDLIKTKIKEMVKGKWN